jgi:porin
MLRRREASLICLVIWALGTIAPAAAESEDEAPQGSARVGRHLLESPWLLGDPGDFRQKLGLYGVTMQLFYTQFLAWKPQGGALPASTFGHNGSYDFLTFIDGKELIGWPGMVALLHVKGQYERSINRDVGALSDPIDDADFDEPIWIDQLWLEQGVLDGRLRVRLGLLEQQTIFDRNAFANSEDFQFSATFLDNNPTVPLPNGLGVVAFLRVADWLEIATGFGDADNAPLRAGFDTVFDGIDSLTGYVELDLHARLPGPAHPLPGAYRLGGFIDGRSLPDFTTGRLSRGHGGVYLSFDQLVFLEQENEAEGLGLFGRFGWADPDVNRIEWFWSLGGQYRGLAPRRRDDVLAIGLYQAIGSDAYRRSVDPRFDKETGIEIYYSAALVPWLAVTPDFQYIFDPGAAGAYDDAVVVMLRFRVQF